jgi:hypothetical protein
MNFKNIAVGSCLLLTLVSWGCNRADNQPPVQDQLVLIRKAMASSDWQSRAMAFGKLQSNSASLNQETVRSSLTALLETENRFLDSTLENSNGDKGVSDTSGEGYSEYYSELIGVVSSYATQGDVTALQAVAQGSYNPNSKVANVVVSGGDPAAAAVLAMAGSPLPLKRTQALPVLAQMAQPYAGTSEATKDRILEALVASTKPGEVQIVRLEAIRSLGLLAGADLSTGSSAQQLQDVLRKLARQEPDATVRRAAALSLSEHAASGATDAAATSPSDKRKRKELQF